MLEFHQHLCKWSLTGLTTQLLMTTCTLKRLTCGRSRSRTTSSCCSANDSPPNPPAQISFGCTGLAISGQSGIVFPLFLQQQHANLCMPNFHKISKHQCYLMKTHDLVCFFTIGCASKTCGIPPNPPAYFNRFRLTARKIRKKAIGFDWLWGVLE